MKFVNMTTNYDYLRSSIVINYASSRSTSYLQKMDLVKESFYVDLFLMRCIGYYPPKRFVKIYNIYKWIYYCIFTFAQPVTAIIFNIMYFSKLSIEELIDNSCLISEIGVEAIKMLPFLINHEKVKETIYFLNNPLFTKYLKSQEHIVQDCINSSRFVTNLFLVMCLASLFSWGAKPLFADELTLPTQVWLPFCIYCNKKIYYSIYILEFLGVMNDACSNSSIDTLIAGLTCHACGQIRILKDSLLNLGEWVDLEVEKHVEKTQEEKKQIRIALEIKRIEDCIKHHNAIILFVKKLEDTFSFAVFLQFLGSSGVICICVFQLTLVEPFSLPFFAIFIFIVTILSEIYMFCYFGTTLNEESTTINEAILMSSWYTYDEKSKKLLKIVMERSKRPLIVTAGKILELSLTTFTTLLRRSSSLFMVLRKFD